MVQWQALVNIIRNSWGAVSNLRKISNIWIWFICIRFGSVILVQLNYKCRLLTYLWIVFRAELYAVHISTNIERQKMLCWIYNNSYSMPRNMFTRIIFQIICKWAERGSKHAVIHSLFYKRLKCWRKNNTQLMYPLLIQVWPTYCDVLPSNTLVISGFWILCSVYWINHQSEFTINYYTLNLIVITLR
jgi:hypothetical protein